MCGEGAVLTGMYAAKMLGANQAQLLNYTNSGEAKHGDPKRVVGYATMVFLKEENTN